MTPNERRLLIELARAVSALQSGNIALLKAAFQLQDDMMKEKKK